MPVTIQGQPPSAAVLADLAREGRPVLLAFSLGKDSIAAWLALQDHGIDVRPYYMSYIPGLRFVQDSVDYFQDHFQTRILQVPHPSFYRWLNALVFQPPERCAVIEAANLPEPEYADVLRLIRDEFDTPGAWVADGVRAADSIVRRLSFTKHGVRKTTNLKVSVVWDWTKAEVYDRINSARIRLPIDYQWFGRSFDGIDYRFLEPLSRYAPDDYARILDWFPLADLELFRHDLTAPVR